MGVGTWRDLHIQASFSSPIISSHIPPCGFCQLENASDEGVLVCLVLAPLADRCWHLNQNPYGTAMLLWGEGGNKLY